VVIGGNGSQSGSAALAAEGLPVVGVASTIRNDLHVRGEILRTPLAEIAGRTRPADTALVELARVLAT